ncbi:fatty acid-binding-like protein 5 [Plakobranchus ocellatus]|uniref:Fatty acid-binding-like protein 5 n=1 Tax=Plakobranchus ocellatus TaxID=259542 RepID=A0AAV4DL87_9GAST|nr:fatty acid-binding-like protein 5 [Plakobranchus ocellatus]
MFPWDDRGDGHPSDTTLLNTLAPVLIAHGLLTHDGSMHCLGVTLVISSLALTMTTSVYAQDYNHTVQLMRTLLTNYDRSVRPILDQSKVLTISTDMWLAAITRVDEKEQTISVRIYFYLWWQDELLTWTPADHGNITILNPLISQVWIPTFNLAGSSYDQQLLVDTSDITPLTVNYTGTVIWFPNVFLSQLCKMDMTKFPYDEHNCTFLLYTVLFSVDQIDIVHDRVSPRLDQYSENGEWELLSSEVAIHVFVSGISPPVHYIRLSMIIRRRPRFFLLNLLFPTLALSFLNILVFVLPADSGEKVGYSITVLLSVMLMMGVTTDVMPESSDVVPLLHKSSSSPLASTPALASAAAAAAATSAAAAAAAATSAAATKTASPTIPITSFPEFSGFPILITQFLTALTIISVLSVVTTVIILFVHHNQEEDARKKSSALSFIRKLKQKVASKKSVHPSGQSGNTSAQSEHKWNHKGQNGDTLSSSHGKEETAASFEKDRRSEVESSDIENISTNCNSAFLKMMKDEQNSLSIGPPQSEAPSHGGPEALFAPNPHTENQIVKQRHGAGGIASLWHRGKQAGIDRTKVEIPLPQGSSNNDYGVGVENSKTDEFFQQLSKNVNMISFYSFLIAWLAVTLGYMTALFI